MCERKRSRRLEKELKGTQAIEGNKNNKDKTNPRNCQRGLPVWRAHSIQGYGQWVRVQNRACAIPVQCTDSLRERHFLSRTIYLDTRTHRLRNPVHGPRLRPCPLPSDHSNFVTRAHPRRLSRFAARPHCRCLALAAGGIVEFAAELAPIDLI